MSIQTRRVPHVRRPVHHGRHPARVTLRTNHKVPSFRQQCVQKVIASVIRDQRKRAYKDEFRIIHFSIETSQVQLVIEADSERAAEKGYAAIRSGVSGFMIAVAKRLNAFLKRKGKVWADRYERLDLTSSAQTRPLLADLFRTLKGAADPFSTSWLVRGGRKLGVPETLLWRWPVCGARTRLGRSIRGRPLPALERTSGPSRIRTWRRARARR
jgi:hypothetical protein